MTRIIITLIDGSEIQHIERVQFAAGWISYRRPYEGWKTVSWSDVEKVERDHSASVFCIDRDACWKTGRCPRDPVCGN